MNRLKNSLKRFSHLLIILNNKEAYMKKILSMALLLWIIQARAQDTPIQQEVNNMQGRFNKTSLINSKPVANNGTYDFSKYVKEFTILDIDKRNLTSIVNNKDHALEVDIPFENTVVTLQLIRNQTVNTNTGFKTASGKEYHAEAGVGYYGVIKNQKNTLVAITFFENNIMGFISNRNGNYSIGKINTVGPLESKYILYNDRSLVSLITPSCNVIQNKINSGQGTSSSAFGSPGKCLKVRIVTDYKIFQKLGTAANVRNYVQGLFQMVQAVYRNESINVYYDANDVLVWDVNDPYGGSLSNFATQMSASGFSGDIAHLLSGYGGGGAAFLNTLCSTAYTRTAISVLIANAAPYWMFPQTYEAKEMAHEMGHNIGSPHTQACFWNDNCTPIDGCTTPEGTLFGGCADCITVMPIPYQGGTIMSYCDTKAGIGVLLENGFGTQPGNYIRSRIASAGCLGSCNTDCFADVTISGTGFPGTYYNNPLTESSTWIKTSGTTKVLGGVVKLDASAGSYVELNPGFEATYDYASTNSVFIAQAYDGCTTGAPNYTFKKGEQLQQSTGRIKDIGISFSVYPNPVTSQFTITSNMDISNARIELFDINGKPQKLQISNKSNKSLMVNVANLTKGVYIIKLTTETKVEFEKITVL